MSSFVAPSYPTLSPADPRPLRIVEGIRPHLGPEPPVEDLDLEPRPGRRHFRRQVHVRDVPSDGVPPAGATEPTHESAARVGRLSAVEHDVTPTLRQGDGGEA